MPEWQNTPGTAWSYVCPYFVIGWPKQAPTCCFKFFCQKNLCALVREVWSQLTADKNILFIPTKRKNLEMKWSEMKWNEMGITTHRNCVYTDIWVCTEECLSISLRHSLFIIKKFKPISFKCFPASVIELVVDSLKR